MKPSSLLRLLLLSGSAIAALTSFTHTGSAQAIALVNPSFEQPAVASGAFSTDVVPGWNKVGTNDIGVHRNNEFGAPATGGDLLQLLFIGNGTAFGSIYQDVTSSTFGGAGVASYTFTISLGTRGGPTFAGTINVGLQDLTGTTAVLMNTFPAINLNATAYQDFSITLPAATVAAGDSLRIFVDKNAGSQLIVVDNARLVANAVPEPSTWAALCAGLGALSGVMRLRRGRAA